MTHEELVERVAWALCVAAGEFPETATPYNRNVDFLWQHYIPDARAAIAEVLAVLKEPTPKMNTQGGLIGDYPWDGNRPSRVFIAMLSASPLASVEPKS